ncbi:class I SAM-dependent methyltransferase [Sporosarcina sp. BI001-red]|uniref:class I SAM-dependent methyltransferase n=1 Tax=Sporosarcina sp. BI001-red TaxID=2282866 RepID=UPI000E228B7C|nr:class I SAM-dependent methyltransferase [Sporosarcina sp. BI001-red]REB07086.1 class I SAM-dependent methyltransferase [Sporosarcina sp. BI001-red]
MTVYNFEEYDDPILYDKENENYQSELPFLLNWASKTRGTIIDLACGTGRVTIPLAQNGYKVIGVDIHTGMLQEAKKKSSILDLKIDWVEQDCTHLNLPIKSNLIYSVGNSFQHFLTNDAQDELLSSVNNHLEIGGFFIFGTRFPNVEELLSPVTEEYWKSYTDPETLSRVDVYTLSNYDSLHQVQHNTTIRRYKNMDGKLLNEKRTNISLRYVFPKEMERTLFLNGFEIVNVYNDWNESPVTNDSYEMIYVCRKR